MIVVEVRLRRFKQDDVGGKKITAEICDKKNRLLAKTSGKIFKFAVRI